MEYISKQSLLADLNEATPRSYFAFETMVREYPTEDVVPVVHAHWIDKHYVELKSTGLYALLGTCSNCNYEVITDESAEYCSNCGAVMDEEEPHEMCFNFEKTFRCAKMDEEV